jgi:hypothetical protein
MNDRFDELAKGLAQSVTRRQAFKKFGLGLAGMALACFGLTNTVRGGGNGCKGNGEVCAKSPHIPGNCSKVCCNGLYTVDPWSRPAVAVCFGPF